MILFLQHWAYRYSVLIEALNKLGLIGFLPSGIIKSIPMPNQHHGSVLASLDWEMILHLVLHIL